MKQKLTNTVINNFTCPEGKQKGFLSDTEVSGLKLRVTASGAKSFTFERRPKALASYVLKRSAVWETFPKTKQERWHGKKSLSLMTQTTFIAWLKKKHGNHFQMFMINISH